MTSRIGDMLVEKGLITNDELEDALNDAISSKQMLGTTLINLGKVTEKDILESVAKQKGINYVDLSNYSIDPSIVKLVKREFCERYCFIPMEVGHRNSIHIAAENPFNYKMVQDVQFAAGKNVLPHLASREDIEDAIDRFYGFDASISELVGKVSDNVELDIAEEGKVTEISQSHAVIQVVNSILVESVSRMASDIHFEPYPRLLKIKIRVDGQLNILMNLPKWIQAAVISRIKIISKMDIAERRIPQDGKLSVNIKGRNIDFRVSTLPTNYGEKAVLRILDKGRQVIDITTLGLEEKDLNHINRFINAQQGMLLVTGPTGSGKTTLLYAMLNQIKKRAKNIITIEDPIEYEIEGINQVQVNEKAGLVFANALRSVLRQDPDVIMVGEIRDKETAEIAFRAAQTGHLVLSTLHTNNAIATIARLRDIGVEPFMISSSLLCIIAQRLVRKNCPDCAAEYKPKEDVLNRFTNIMPADTAHKRGKGCKKCSNMGYKGRTGVYELLRFTPNIIDAVNMSIPEEQFKKTARQEGMGFLIDKCVKLIRSGITSVDECAELAASTTMLKHTCPSCGEEINLDFAVCPYCQYFLSKICPSCKNPIELGWKSCPFCMTVLQQPEAKSESKEGVSRRKSERPLILVVDDEVQIRKAVSIMLKQINCDCIEAGDGRNALDKIESQHPDLIISDINMPVMDGYELCKNLRRNIRTTFIPFIMLTSRDSAEDKLKGFTHGTDDYITKPFDYKDLQARVKRQLSRAYPEYREEG